MQALTHADFRAMRRFPALDGLRALAALAVVFYHLGGSGWDRLEGWIGVQAFFVLSGFLITTLALREEDRSGRLWLPGFYTRRAFRILPVYLVVFAIVIVCCLFMGTFISSGVPQTLPYYLTFNNDVYEGPTPFGVSWTLGIEQKFYLVWPLIAFVALAGFAKRGKAFGPRLGLTIGSIMVAFAIGALTDSYRPLHYISLLVGCLLAVLMHHPRGFALVRPLTHRFVALPIAVAFIGVQLCLTPVIASLGGQRERVTTGYAVVFAILIVAVLVPGPAQRLLSSRPLAFIGERSYALYLTHGLGGLLFPSLLPDGGTLKAIVITVIALVLSDALYRWVELPMINQGRKLTSRWRAAKSTPPAQHQPQPA